MCRISRGGNNKSEWWTSIGIDIGLILSADICKFQERTMTNIAKALTKLVKSFKKMGVGVGSSWVQQSKTVSNKNQWSTSESKGEWNQWHK